MRAGGGLGWRSRGTSLAALLPTPRGGGWTSRRVQLCPLSLCGLAHLPERPLVIHATRGRPPPPTLPPSAIELLRECPQLRIEDVLPHLPDFATIADFQEHLCVTLEAYECRVAEGRVEIAEAMRSTARIEGDMRELERKYATLPAGSGAACAGCARPLWGRRFRLFPCSHAFHPSCLGTAGGADDVVGRSPDPALPPDHSASYARPPGAPDVGCRLCGDALVALVDVPLA